MGLTPSPGMDCSDRWARCMINPAPGVLCSGSRPVPGPSIPLPGCKGPWPPLLQSSRPPPPSAASLPPSSSTSSPVDAMATESARPWQPKEPLRGVPGWGWGRGCGRRRQANLLFLGLLPAGISYGLGGGCKENAFSEPSGQGAAGLGAHSY